MLKTQYTQQVEQNIQPVISKLRCI